MTHRPTLASALLLTMILAVGASSNGAVRAEDATAPEVQADGAFEIPKTRGGVGLVNRADDFAAMWAEVLPRVGEVADAKEGQDRETKIAALAEDYGDRGIDCLVRIREPFMVPVFGLLLAHESWGVRRLAVFGLQRNVGIVHLDGLVALLGDENFLVREIAATTIAILHNLTYHAKTTPALKTREGKRAVKAAKKRKKSDLKALEAAREKETNPYVCSAMDASIRALKKFRLLKICDEFTEEDPSSGVHFVPRAGRPKSTARSKSGGSSKMKPSKSWCYPIAVYPGEVMGSVKSDPPLVPLAAKNNSLHFGHDCAWMLPGCGVYAIGDGQLRTVELAGDFGVLIVGEYRVSRDEFVTALNGHCSMWAFAEPGAVTCRQLLGTVGLDFSVENGIHHAAHNHFGMFEGNYDRGRCYGRSGAGRSTKGWLEPAAFLGPKVVGKEIDPDSY